MMNLNNPTSDFYWKIYVFGALNLCVMLVLKLFECSDFRLHCIYVLLQDMTMWNEFKHQWRGVNPNAVTFAYLINMILNTGWLMTLYWFTLMGIHSFAIRDFLTKPEYCKGFNQRLGI